MTEHIVMTEGHREMTKSLVGSTHYNYRMGLGLACFSIVLLLKNADRGLPVDIQSWVESAEVLLCGRQPVLSLPVAALV